MPRGGKRAGAGRKPNPNGPKLRAVSGLPVGGWRAGSGRKEGAATVRTRDIADQAAADGGLMPLEVLLNAMRQALLDGDVPFAVSIARDAAPYCHARLGAITVKAVGGGGLDIFDPSVLSDEELEAHIQRLRERDAEKPTLN